jgi:hypothetical protein
VRCLVDQGGYQAAGLGPRRAVTAVRTNPHRGPRMRNARGGPMAFPARSPRDRALPGGADMICGPTQMSRHRETV